MGSLNIFNNVGNVDKKIEELEKENMNLKMKLELKEMDKSMVSINELKKLQNENLILQSELYLEKEKNIKASEKINQLEESLKVSTFIDNDKIKKYKIVFPYVKQVLNLWKPNEKNEKDIFDKLKNIIEEDDKVQ